MAFYPHQLLLKMLLTMRTCEQKRKKRHVTIAQKLDLIEQNQCDFWIQRIRFVLNQLKKTQTTNSC